MRTKLCAGFAVVAMLLAGCGPAQQGSPSSSVTVPKPQVSSDFVSRLDGSTAMLPLGLAIGSTLTGSNEGILFNKTETAYDNLIEGDKDLILVTDQSTDHINLAHNAGVELEAVPVAKDVLIFLANPDNPVSNLSGNQMQGIYTGKTTSWAQFGGSDTNIVAYQNQEGSTSQAMFMQAMGRDVPLDAPMTMRLAMGVLVDLTASYDNSADAIGYSMFSEGTGGAKMLAINGVTPSAQTIADGSYPYVTYYYAVLRKDAPADSDARKVAEWLAGDEGQQLASKAGYVPLNPANIQSPEPAYGYSGSTRENTTQSSGTGGAAPKPMPAVANESAPLSDYFYDSVNYISYINANLFNKATNLEYDDWLEGDQLYPDGIAHDPAAGFTGIPSDYTNFTVNEYQTEGLLLEFTFPQGNPFISQTIEPDVWGEHHLTNQATIGLWIPADLSPYARISSTRWAQNSAGQFYPVLTTTSTPSASDKLLNGEIEAQMSAHPDMRCFWAKYGAEHVSLVGYANAKACQSPSEGPYFPTLVGQWGFGAWDEDPMTIADLPSTWRTKVADPYDWLATTGIACEVKDEHICWEISPDETITFTDSAVVDAMWAEGQTIDAIVEDQGSIYSVPYTK